MKKEIFEKVVEYEPYEWQKRDYDLNDLLCFLVGVGVTLFILGNLNEAYRFFCTHKFHIVEVILGILLIMFALIFSNKRKKKIYWRKVR